MAVRFANVLLVISSPELYSAGGGPGKFHLTLSITAELYSSLVSVCSQAVSDAVETSIYRRMLSLSWRFC